MRTTSSLAALLVLCPFLTSGLRAASLEVSPVSVELASDQSTAIIELQNRDKDGVTVQARAFRWTQSGDTDELSPTDDILVSPPIFTVAPNDTQTVRLMLRKAAMAGVSEKNFRLLFDEVPPPMLAKGQVTILLRLSIPVSVAPLAGGEATLKWIAQHDAQGQPVLAVTNAGAIHAKIEKISVTLSDGSHPKVKSAGTNPYVLAGSTRRWTLAGKSPAGTIQVSITTNLGKTQQTLVP